MTGDDDVLDDAEVTEELRLHVLGSERPALAEGSPEAALWETPLPLATQGFCKEAAETRFTTRNPGIPRLVNLARDIQRQGDPE